MTTLRLNAQEPEDIAGAAALLRRGLLVAMPTETVYGLAANALDAQAAARIFAAKGRPQDNPLIVHVPDVQSALPLVTEFPARAQALAAAFWPGPLTIILPKSACVPGVVSAGLSTVAVRVPAHPAALALLRASALPLAAPSANTSGAPSPTQAAHVLHDLDGKIAAVLDGGCCSVGVESTVLTLAAPVPTLLRPGGVTLAQLRAVLGEVAVSPAVLRALGGEPAVSPGMKYRHYAPRAQLTLVRGSLERFAAYAQQHAQQAGDGLLVFDGDKASLEGMKLPLLTYGDAAQAWQRQLFARLREIDALGLRRVFVRCPAQEGDGLAAYNRLLRAAAFRLVEADDA